MSNTSSNATESSAREVESLTVSQQRIAEVLGQLLAQLWLQQTKQVSHRTPTPNQADTS